MSCPRCGGVWEEIGPGGGVCRIDGFITRSEIEARQFVEESDGQQSTRPRSLADDLVDLATAPPAVFFKDQFGEPFVAPRGDGSEVIGLTKEAGKLWLGRMAWDELGKAVGTEVLRSTQNVLASRAIFSGETLPLSVRVARHDGAIWYDLGDGRAVRIIAGAWELIDRPPILFRRLNHQRSQVEPVQGGQLTALLQFTNITDQGSRILELATLVVSLVPDIPHPIIARHGPQGSGKSTIDTIWKSLLDPSQVQRLTPPDNSRELVQAASHHWYLPLDNLTHLPAWLSDALCRLSTGDGFVKRKLYTDDEDKVYAYKRLVALNGINLVVTKPDLLDRAVIIYMDRISDNFRREETEFWQKFEELKPVILGAMFDVLAQAMIEFESVILTSRPRMADFCRWGCAVSRAIGYADSDFLDALRQNIRRQNDEAIDASPVAQAVIALMEERSYWSDTPSATLDRLKDIADVRRIDTRQKAWPGDARWLWRRIQEVNPNLQSVGIRAERGRNDDRNITLRRTDETDDSDDGDGGDVEWPEYGSAVESDVAVDTDNTDNSSEIISPQSANRDDWCSECGVSLGGWPLKHGPVPYFHRGVAYCPNHGPIWKELK